MPATATCLPQVQACALRVARLDGSGVPAPGASNLYVSSAMSKLTVTPVYSDADEIEEKNACGAVVISYKGNASFKRADFELELLTPDPQLVELLTNGSLLTTSSSYGSAAPAIGEVTGTYFSLEVWSRQIRDGVVDATYPYAWWAFPAVKNTRFSPITFENAAKKITITGEMYENANWYNGPDNTWPSTSDRVWQWIPWASIPTAQCGYQTISAS